MIETNEQASNAIESSTLLDAILELQVEFDRKAKELGIMSGTATSAVNANRCMIKAGCYRACANDIRRVVRDTSNENGEPRRGNGE